MKTSLIATLALAALVLPVRAQTNSTLGPNDDFPATFDKVVAYAGQDELSGMDVARSTFEATKLFATGSRTVPYVEQRFRGARGETEAAVAGLYMCVHGKDPQLETILAELETNKTKRTWLKREVGSEAAFFDAVDAGAYWQDFLHILPSTAGVRKLSRMCMASKDPLVRRAGMLWGYFFADAAYAPSLKGVAADDPDPVTRRIATRLSASLAKHGY